MKIRAKINGIGFQQRLTGNEKDIEKELKKIGTDLKQLTKCGKYKEEMKEVAVVQTKRIMIRE